MRGDTQRRDVDTNDDVTTKTNIVHMKRDLSSECVHVVFLSVCVVVIFTHYLHTTSRGPSGPRVCTHLIHQVSVILRL